MDPLFKISHSNLPVPVLAKDAAGVIREPDGVTYFDLDGAAAASGLPRESLERVYAVFVDDITGGPPAAEAEMGPRFVSIEDEQREAAPIIELKDIDANDVRERVRRRMAGEMPPELYEDFKEQMKDLGYDIVRRECYPVLQYNEETKRNEVVCCATLAAVEAKVLASGLCDGWDPILYAGPDGELRPMWLDDKNPPYLVQATVYRKGQSRPTVAVMRWDQCAQFVQNDKGERRLTQYWRERPVLAIEKCAKMKAMREGFRDVVGTVYAREELHVLSGRHQSMIQQSSTLSGLRHRALPNLGSTSQNDGEPRVEVEAVRTEEAFRSMMRSRGLVQDFMINNVIAQAKKDWRGDEDVDPEAFWTYAAELAGKRYGVRR